MAWSIFLFSDGKGLGRTRPYGLFDLGSVRLRWFGVADLDLADPANRGVVALAVWLILIAALFQVLDGVQVVAVGALRGYRDTAVPMLCAAFGYWVVGFTGGWVLAFPLGLGPVGLWWGLLLGLGVVTVLLTLRLESRARATPREPMRTVGQGDPQTRPAG